jgi:hypothetical protein
MLEKQMNPYYDMNVLKKRVFSGWNWLWLWVLPTYVNLGVGGRLLKELKLRIERPPGRIKVEEE